MIARNRYFRFSLRTSLIAVAFVAPMMAIVASQQRLAQHSQTGARRA